MNSFLERFPEYNRTDLKLLARVIQEAQNELDPNMWGALYESGWHYLAADKLALSPMGEPVRLEGTSNQTTYRLEFERLCRFVAIGARVA